MCRLYAAQRFSFPPLQRSLRWSITVGDAQSILLIGTGVCGFQEPIALLAEESSTGWERRAGANSQVAFAGLQQCFLTTASEAN